MNRKTLLMTSLLVCTAVLGAQGARAVGMFVAPVPAVDGVLTTAEADAFTRAVESAVLKRIVEVDVVTPRALDTKLELDLVKACESGDDTSCIVDFAQSMGVQYVVRTQVVRLGDIALLTISLYDGRRAALLGQGQRQRATMAQLLDEVPGLLQEVARAGELTVVVEKPKPTPYLAIAEISGGSLLLLGSVATHVLTFLVIDPAYARAELDRNNAATWELARPVAYAGPVVGYVAGATLVGVGIYTLTRENP